MAVETILLSEHVKSIADARAAAAGYPNVSQYLDALILADAGEPVSPALEAHLLTALKSAPIEVTPAYWDNKRKNLSDGFLPGR